MKLDKQFLLMEDPERTHNCFYAGFLRNPGATHMNNMVRLSELLMNRRSGGSSFIKNWNTGRSEFGNPRNNIWIDLRREGIGVTYGNFCLRSGHILPSNILQQPAFMIGFCVLIGIFCFRDHGMIFWAGTIKAIVGYLIRLLVPADWLTTSSCTGRWVERFNNINATVIDPYFGQNTVTANWRKYSEKGFGRCDDPSVCRIY